VAVVRARTQGRTAVQETHWYNRVGALKGLGNAIVPQVAEAFVRSYLDSISLTAPAASPAGESGEHG
jgi:hypothetical protein